MRENTLMHPHVYAKKVACRDTQAICGAIEYFFKVMPCTEKLTPDSKVLIKPNLLRANTPDKAVTTHPVVIYAIIKSLKKRGVTDITVADSPGGRHTSSVMKNIYKTCGIDEVCKKTNVKTYIDDEFATLKTNGEMVREFTVLAPVKDCDFIINVPKMKTHVLTRVSCAVKNLFGCVPGLQKAEFHMRFPEKEDFSSMIVDLCCAVKADMHIVDGLIAMEGDGPGSGTPRRCDLLFCGGDPYLVDMVVSQAMQMPMMEVPILKAANKRGLCPENLPENTLIGDDAAKQPISDFKPPRSYTGKLDFSSSAPKLLRPVISLVATKIAPKPWVIKSKCITCRKCAEICPQKTITMEKSVAKIDYTKCIKCFCCHEVCPVHAVDIKRVGLFGH